MADFNCFEDDSELNGWERAEQYAIEAQELYEEGHLQDALARLDDAVLSNPDCASWHFNRGLTLDALGRYEEAIDCYQNAIMLSPEDLEIFNSLAVDYTRTAQYDMSLALFEQIEKKDPEFEPAYCNRIITYTEMEQYDRAEQMFYLAQQINPECPICFYNIGNSLFSQGKYSRAIWCWKKTAVLDPGHPQIHYRIAQACWADKQYDDAKDSFLKALRSNPGDAEMLLDYGVFLLETGRVDAAAEKFRWIQELHPDFAPAVFYLGEIHRMANRLDAAIGCYRKAIQMDGDCPGARYRVAQILLSQDKAQEVHDLLAEEFRLDCQDNQVLLSMGMMLVRVDAYDDAVQCFLRVMDNNPAEGQAYFGMSAILMHKKDLNGCLQFLEHAVELDVSLLTAYTCTALIHCRQGGYDRALQALNRAGAVVGDSWKLRRWKIKVHYLRLKQIVLNTFKSRGK